MAKISFRVSDEEKAEIEGRAARAGVDLSALCRQALDLERDAPDHGAQLDDHERRLSRLEDMAGL